MASDRSDSPPCWAMTAEEALAYWETGSDGLSDADAADRRRLVGPNELPEGTRLSPLRVLLNQFHDPMVQILMGATALAYFLGEHGDAITIMAIILLNSLLGFALEFRAENSLALLRKLAAPQATVVRDGNSRLIPARDLVPGDVVLLEAGDRVAADGRLIWAVDLESDESTLTGESFPTTKDPSPIPPALPMAERRNVMYQGAVVVRGRGAMVVTATGEDTEIGRLADSLRDETKPQTPLQCRLHQLGRYLVAACLTISTWVVVAGILRGEPAYNMFLSGVSLAVAAIPEGLPAVVTISLALGVQRMVRSNVIIRRLSAVEALGCATVICSDKTGTLTANHLDLQVVAGLKDEWRVPPSGDDRAWSHMPAMCRAILQVAGWCNNTNLSARADPTERALFEAFDLMGRGRSIQKQKGCLAWTDFHREGEIAFDSERKLMSVWGWLDMAASRRERVLLTKGAPEAVLDRCRGYVEFTSGRECSLTAGLRQAFMDRAAELAARGFRVLGASYRILPEDWAGDQKGAPGSVENSLVMLGLVCLLDPPRPESTGAVAQCRSAGIVTYMVTGDHPLTARAVARRLRLLDDDDRVLTGEELESMDPAEFTRALRTVRVFARVSPRHKLEIVRALRKQGHVVAMTGDGVNDAPALKEAHIGIAMGQVGTDITRETADVVLADDNFASVVAGIRVGRGIYDNIRKFIRYLLACNTGEVLVMLGAVVFGLPLPLMPIQILLVNLVTDGPPAIALGLDHPHPTVMRRAPRSPREGVLGGGLAGRILGRGLLIAITSLAVFWWALGAGRALPYARSMVLLTLVLSQLLHVFECRREGAGSGPGTVNPYLVGAVASSVAATAAVLYLPGLAAPAYTCPVALADAVVCFLGAAAGTMIAGLRGVLTRRRRWHVVRPRGRAA